jgi:pimeloyl-ACP methyl ester carboxylesterase
VIRNFYVDGLWGQVHGRRAGQGGVPLVLLHQSPLSAAQFLPALERLAEAGFDAIALDTPGFGLSAPPSAPTTIAAYAQALAITLDALGLSTTHLLGHHTGAAIAANFAARHPHRVGKLVLNGVPLFTDDELAFFKGFNFGPLVPQADGSHLTAAWAQRLRATPGWTDLDAMHRHVADMLSNPQRNHWGFLAALDYRIAPDLMALTSPTLILSNSGDDLHAASMRAADLRPEYFDWHALDGGTHDIVDEQPAAWAAAVAAYLAG